MNVDPAAQRAGLVWLGWLVLAAWLLVAATSCASPSEESDDDRRGVSDMGLRVIGQPSEEALAAREGRSHLRFRVQDYEHHLERRSPDGRITLVSDPPNAQVFVVGRGGMETYMGDAPLDFFARANGMSHIFVLRQPGYVDRRIDVAVSYRNPDVRVSVMLEEDRRQRQADGRYGAPFENLTDYWNVRESVIYSRDMPVERPRHSHTRFPDSDSGEELR